MSLIQLEYVKYRVGYDVPQAVLDAPHATPPCSEPPTGDIANSVSQSAGCHCIIGTISRTEADLNRSPKNEVWEERDPQAIYEYRDTIRRILDTSGLIDEHNSLNQPFLHLQIHGMKDRSLDAAKSYDLDVEVGTREKMTCSSAVHDWIISKVKDWGRTVEGRKKVVVGANRYFRGDSSKEYHRHGDGDNYQGYGTDFHSVQIEFTRWLRSEHRPDIERLLTEVVEEFGTIGTN